jgi:Na+/H+ antiporter NhaD/arsenite permease-like protein
MNSVISAMTRLFCFYYDGFRTMSWWGKRVWIIILIKLFIIFIILKIFFFQDFLQKKYDTDKQKSEYVLDQLINSK